MITVTPQAAEQIRQAAQQSEAAELALRIAAKRLADGSIDYGMGFDEEREDDLRVESEGVTVLVSPPSQSLLAGTTLDFVELAPGDFRFIFVNPQADEPPAKSGCGTGGCGSGGCGSSGGGCS
jgi:iron-sulfur cluster assembly protein